MAGDAERHYPINGHEAYCFYAGLMPDNRQVLMGLFCPNLVGFVFDSEGNLLAVEQRPVGFMQYAAPPYDIYDDRIPPLIDEWKQEIGFRAATIKVKRFFSREHYIGIEHYPSHFEETLSDLDVCEDEKRDVCNSKRLWDEAGQFVLVWGNDYFLDGSGEVVSS